MSFPHNMFQPGKVLNEVIVGCFRSAGTNLDQWCRENAVNRASAMSATYGRSGGDRGKELLEKMIADAGFEAVKEAYRRRIMAEAAKLAAVA